MPPYKNKRRGNSLQSVDQGSYEPARMATAAGFGPTDAGVMVGDAGFAPATPELKVLCSAE